MDMEGRGAAVDDTSAVSLDLDDIQAGALYERPSPYVGVYLLLSIRDRADGRALVRRLHRLANPAGSAETPDNTSVTVAFTYHGLKAARGAAGVLGQLRTRVPGRDGCPGRDPG